jgi:hypothetical protein
MVSDVKSDGEGFLADAEDAHLKNKIKYKKLAKNEIFVPCPEMQPCKLVQRVDHGNAAAQVGIGTINRIRL